jgi:hypothetical protein
MSYQSIDVVVNVDGSGAVNTEGAEYDQATKKTSPRNVRYSFLLSSDELGALKVKIGETKFFEQPDRDTQWATDQGRSVMYVALDGKKRRIEYEYRREMYPIVGFLLKLVNQAQVMDGLKRGKVGWEFCYLGSSDSSDSGVLQPRAFIEPMKDYMRKANDPEKLGSVAGWVSARLTTEEWLGFWTKELDAAKEPRLTTLITLLSEVNPGTTAQHKAMTPLLFEYLRQNYQEWPQMSDDKRTACYRIIGHLADEHYVPAIPMFVDMMKRKFEVVRLHDKPIPFNILPGELMDAVAKMGTKGIEAAQPFFTDSDPKLREFAVNVMSFSVPKDANTIYPYSGEPEEAAWIMKKLQAIAPDLKRISESDSDQLVACSAKMAFDRIQKGYSEAKPAQP